MRSAPGGTSSATRSPGRTPVAASPAARSRTRWSSRANDTRPAARPSSTTAARRVARAGGRAPPTAAAPPAGVGLVAAPAVAAPSRSPTQRHTSAAAPRRVLGDQVRGPLVAVHLRVRQPVEQVAQVEVGEHRVPRAPEQQRRHVGEGAQPVGDPVQRGGARVRRVERDVGDEVADRPPPRRPCAYGAASASRTAAGSAGRDSARGGADERRRAPRRWSAAAPRRPGQPDQRRARRRRPAGAPRCWSARRRAAGRGGPSAQPSETGPPQSWATVTTGPVMPRAVGQRHRGRRPAAARVRGVRCARTSPCRAGRPRPPASRRAPAARNRRHR